MNKTCLCYQNGGIMIRILLVFLVSLSSAHALNFTVRSQYTYMHETVELSRCVLSNQEYQSEIMSITEFDYSDHDGIQVLNNMFDDRQVIYSTYRSRNPWSRVIAYRNIGSSWVYFNRRRNPRPYRFMVNTAIHEASHVKGYGHGNNSSVGKEDSVPYKIGALAEKYVARCMRILGIEEDYKTLDHSRHYCNGVRIR